MILKLLHGRLQPYEEMNGPGFAGPVVSGIKNVRGVYTNHLDLEMESEEAADAAEAVGQRMGQTNVWVEYCDDMLSVRGLGFFGDWELRDENADASRVITVASTAAAVMDELRGHAQLYDRLYETCAGGFPDVWEWCARVASEGERVVGSRWSSGELDFLDSLELLPPLMVEVAEAVDASDSPDEVRVWELFLERMDACGLEEDEVDGDEIDGSGARDVWESDATYTRDEWKNQVCGNLTNLGYWEWVDHAKESAQHDQPTE